MGEDRLSDLTRQYRLTALRLFKDEKDTITAMFARVESADDLLAIATGLKNAMADADGYFARIWTEEFARLDSLALDLASEEVLGAIGLEFGSNFAQSIALTAYNRADSLAAKVGETTAANITDAIYQAINTGEDASALIASQVYDTDMSLSRAELISRTELHGTLVQGEYEMITQTGVFSEKEWLHSGNSRHPRDWHMEMDGERAGLDEAFSNGLMFPGDPDGPPEEVINCGCGVLYFD